MDMWPHRSTFFICLIYLKNIMAGKIYGKLEYCYSPAPTKYISLSVVWDVGIRCDTHATL
jgi:hypothetical protein